MIQVAAPCNLFADGNNADTLGCRHHIARVQNGFRPGMFYVDFSFNRRHTRAFRAGIYGENSSGDGYRAIRSTHVKVPSATPRRLHDDAPLVEMNGGVATRGGHRQFRALIHFHLGASKSRTLARELALVRMNSLAATSSPAFNARSPAGPMRYACPSTESIRARLPGGPAKYQLPPAQTKATNKTTDAVARDNLAKFH